MDVVTGRYVGNVALQPWDYGGPEHVHHVPHVAIVDGAGLLVEIEEGFGEPPGPDEAFESVPVRAGGALRALLVHPPAAGRDGAVRMRALGYMELEGDEACGRWLGQRTGMLLKLLVCRRYRVMHTQDIAEELWGHGGFVSSGAVRQCVHDLREKLGDAAGLVLTRQCGYALNHDAIVDADDFAVHVRRGIAAADRGQAQIATVHLRRAVAMYRGDFLSDEPQAAWAQPERERLREHMEDALGTLAELSLATADEIAATACLRRLAEMRPLDADVHRRLLTVLLAQGRRSHAARCYEGFRARLARDFGVPPEFALADVGG